MEALSPIEDWALDASLNHLNHGSFGALLRDLSRRHGALRAHLERDPLGFMLTEHKPRLELARDALAEFVQSARDDILFVPNATHGVNAVARSLELEPGDELLVTDHGYGACNKTMQYVAKRVGARVIRVEVPFPLAHPEDVVARVIDACTARTKVALIDHVTSPTALVLPVEQIVAELGHRGIFTIVDGAHAPGMVPLALEELGADAYTGNLHKWTSAPRGSGFLWLRREHHDWVEPTVISHGYGAELPGLVDVHERFDWLGTMDYTAWMMVPEALELLGQLHPEGWNALISRNRALAIEGRRVLLERFGLDAPCPVEMIGSMASVPILDDPGPAPDALLYQSPQQRALLERHGIEVPLVQWPGYPKRLVRLSAHAYNHLEQYEALADALSDIGAV